MSGDHSIIPMSSAARRVQCPASAVQELMHPESEDTGASREGTAAHGLIPTFVDAFARAANPPSRESTVGTLAPNGVAYEDDMYDGALTCARDIQRVMRDTGTFGGPFLSIEKPVQAPRIHAQSWGTPDCWLYDPAKSNLYVWDYKHGHRPVEVYENWQLIEYAAGILEEVAKGRGVGLEDQYIDITFTIVQPRAPHPQGSVRRWTVRASDLRGMFNIASAAEHEALGSDPTMRTGVECLDCKARHVCPALRAKGGAAMDVAQRSESHSLSADALSVELRMIYEAETALKARRTGLEAQAEAMIESGSAVPGLTTETTFGRVKWTMDAKQIAQVGDMLGVNLRKEPDVVTPKQAEGKGLDPELVRQYSHKPTTGKKLVIDTQSRAARVFGNINGEH